MVIQARRRLPLGQTSQIIALILFSYVGTLYIILKKDI